MARAPPPGLLSSVFIHTVDQVVVHGDEVADEGCRAQPRALSLWQQHLEVTVEVQVVLAELSRDLNLA